MAEVGDSALRIVLFNVHGNSYFRGTTDREQGMKTVLDQVIERELHCIADVIYKVTPEERRQCMKEFEVMEEVQRRKCIEVLDMLTIDQNYIEVLDMGTAKMRQKCIEVLNNVTKGELWTDIEESFMVAPQERRKCIEDLDEMAKQKRWKCIEEFFGKMNPTERLKCVNEVLDEMTTQRHWQCIEELLDKITPTKRRECIDEIPEQNLRKCIEKLFDKMTIDEQRKCIAVILETLTQTKLREGMKEALENVTSEQDVKEVIAKFGEEQCQKYTQKLLDNMRDNERQNYMNEVLDKMTEEKRWRDMKNVLDRIMEECRNYMKEVLDTMTEEERPKYMKKVIEKMIETDIRNYMKEVLTEKECQKCILKVIDMVTVKELEEVLYRVVPTYTTGSLFVLCQDNITRRKDEMLRMNLTGKVDKPFPAEAGVYYRPGAYTVDFKVDQPADGKVRWEACVLTSNQGRGDMKILLVSWHGPSKITDDKKADLLKDLVISLEKLRKEMSYKAVIVGGDFNLSCVKLQEYIREWNDPDPRDIAVYGDYDRPNMTPKKDGTRSVKEDPIDCIMYWPKRMLQKSTCKPYVFPTLKINGRVPFDHPIVVYELHIRGNTQHQTQGATETERQREADGENDGQQERSEDAREQLSSLYI